MTTRTGKIARLPRAVREELNQRLSDGESQKLLVGWLNARPEVQALLATHFKGAPITEQNLTDWKQGGYEDWLRFQSTRDWVRQLVDRSSDLAEETDNIAVSDWLSAPVAIVLGRYIQRLANEEPPTFEQQRNILALTRELTRLRNGDHQQQLLRLHRDRLEAACQPANPPSLPANPA